MGYRILVVGSGAREHALAIKLLASPGVERVLVCPGNAGTERLGERLGPGKSLRNHPGPVRDLARAERVDLVVIGPEAPLCAGLVDELEADGILAFGPSRQAARLEGSKLFMKEFARRHGIRTARHHPVSDLSQARRALEDFAEPPVIKADGLCAGKGVVVPESFEQARAAVEEMLSGRAFGDAGRRLVLEERIRGEEASVLGLSDGERVLVLPPAQDHKRIGEGDTGPNTGGMGSYAPAPLVSPELCQRIHEEVLLRAVHGMRREGIPYRGTLYAGLMITEAGEPVLLEFNVRFGDPETQALLRVVEGDLAEALLGAARGSLDPSVLVPNGDHALCVVLAAAGYPGTPRTGDPIEGLERAETVPGVEIYHAGTRLDGGRLVTAGGRVLAVTARAPTLKEAHQRAYQAAELICFEGRQMRRDIGLRALTRWSPPSSG